MRFFTILLSFFFTIINYLFAQPDSLWSKQYAFSTYWDEAYCVRQVDDGGYIFTGYVDTPDSDYQVIIFKTDPLGDTLWTRYFGTTYCDEGKCIATTRDGGFIAAAYKGDAVGCDFWILKTDAEGILEWDSVLDLVELGIPRHIINTVDNGYIVIGSECPTSGDNDIIIWKLDQNGGTEWYRIYNEFTGWDEGYWIEQTSDGGYIISGKKGYDCYVAKTDSRGNITWEFSDAFDPAHSVMEIEDGYLAATDYYSDLRLLKFDFAGNLIWSQNYNDIDAGAIQSAYDGGYYLAAGGYSFILFKISSNYNVEWTAEWDHMAQDFVHFVTRTSDGGYIICGSTKPQYGPADTYFLKTVPEQIQLSVETDPFSTPILIPANGGQFEFDIQISNNDLFPRNADIWTLVTLPNGNEYGPIILVDDFTLLSGQTISRRRTQSVPAGAPQGNYTYDAYIGIYPYIKWGEDHFTFTKLPGDASNSSYQTWECSEWIEADASRFNLEPLTFDFTSASPNPFNPSTTLTYSLIEASEVSLIVYDICGREVAKLVSGFQSAGTHQAEFRGDNAAGGIYFASLTSQGQSKTVKMLLLK